MTSLSEKGGGTFGGIRLLLCENPLPPIDEAITVAQTEVARSNHYTEPYSAPLRRLISRQIAVPERLIHINAGSELILRQLFDRFGQQVHLPTPTYARFPEIARRYTETRLLPERDFAFDLRRRDILVEPLNDPALGPGFLGITTALPEDNRHFVDTLREVLAHA